MTVLYIIIVLSVLVLVHEAGHFLAAKRAGMKVEEFGLGFPPRIFGFQKGETTYSINWILFGGFVKILGEDGENASDPRSFAAASKFNRSRVILAGVIMNVILAFVLFSSAKMMGVLEPLENNPRAAQATDVRIQIDDVLPGSPAEKAGLKQFDIIKGFETSQGEVDVSQTSQVQDYISQHPDQEIVMLVAPNDSPSTTVQKKITPVTDPTDHVARIGIALGKNGFVKYGFGQSLYTSLIDTYEFTKATAVGLFQVIKNLIIHFKPGVQVYGPVGIAKLTGEASRVGFSYLLQFIALLSINLAVLNVIPIPALDGGRFLFIIIEAIRRKSMSRKLEGILNTASFSLLILLIILVTVRDIIHLI